MAKTVKDWFRPLARWGYTSRGIVYLIVGCLALLASFDAAQSTDTKGAVRKLLEQPFGPFLGYCVVLGLTGFVLWRLIQALLDTDDHGWSLKGLAVRIGLLSSGFTYSLLALYTLWQLGVLPSRFADGGRSVAGWLSDHIGIKPVLVALALIFAGVTVAHWYKALSMRYAKHFDQSRAIMEFVHPVSIGGLVSRGVIFAIICFLLIMRLFSVDPAIEKPPGLLQVLDYVQSLPAGEWWLGLLGVGMILFAAYSICEGMWRRINLEDAAGID